MRTAPEGIHPLTWEAFNEWCEDHGIGEHVDDWTVWWECWLAGYTTANEQ